MTRPISQCPRERGSGIAVVDTPWLSAPRNAKLQRSEFRLFTARPDRLDLSRPVVAEAHNEDSQLVHRGILP